MVKKIIKEFKQHVNNIRYFSIPYYNTSNIDCFNLRSRKIKIIQSMKEYYYSRRSIRHKNNWLTLSPIFVRKRVARK